MRSRHNDADCPPGILAGIREGREGSAHRMIEWLFESFRGKVDPDRLADVLLKLLVRVSNGFLPTNPTGLLRTMLSQQRSDERRRSKSERSAKAAWRARSPASSSRDSAVGLFAEELRREAMVAQFTRIVFFGDLRGFAPAIVWEHLHNGRTFQEVADLLTRAWNVGMSADRVRRLYFKARQHLKGLDVLAGSHSEENSQLGGTKSNLARQ